MNEIEDCLTKLEKEEQGKEKDDIIGELNKELFRIENKLNRKMLCENCKKEIENLTDKCGNEEIARFLCQYKINARYYHSEYIRWIPFDEFSNIEYLAKSGIGEVHKAIWIDWSLKVVLKRIYNSSDKIADILNEVKVYH